MPRAVPCRSQLRPKLYNQEDENTHLITGCVYKDSITGKLQCYWKPEAVEDSLEGWYFVPSNGDIEEGTGFNLPNTGRR